MFTRATAALLAATLFAGCDVAGKKAITTEPASISARSLSAGETAELERALSQSPEIAELARIRDELTARARQRGVTTEMVRAAYRNGNTAEIEALFGLTSGESTALTERLESIQRRLYHRYPVLRSITQGETATSQTCNADAAARALARGTGGGETGIQSTEVAEPVDDGGCKWLQYTAALAVCTTAGPVIYWPCAYLAYCSFCTDTAGVCA
jgi:hypothetical protein